MRKIAFIMLSVLILFISEFFLFNLGGRWLMPNLLLLAVIYVNLTFGIRYSILTAVLAGIFKDSFSASIFGINIFAFVVCAYMVTILKKYLHNVTSYSSKLLLVFCVTVIHIFMHFCLQMMFDKVYTIQFVRFVFFPEIVTTLLVTSFIFTQLKKCVLKLSV